MVKVAELKDLYKNNKISLDEFEEKLRWSTKEIQETMVDQHRWTTVYKYIVQDDENRYWQFYLQKGNTECQENEPFDGNVIEVEPYKKTIIDYRPIEDESFAIYI